MKLSKFIKECQENNVLKNLSIYIVSSWVFLQVIALIAEPLGFSMKVVAYCLIALLIGFPLYIFFVWKYQLAPNVKRKPLLDETGEPIPGKYRKNGFQRLYFAFLSVIGIICFSVALFIINNNLSADSPVREWEASDKIAVLRFKNLTGNTEEDMAVVGEMAVHRIIHGITRNKLAQVISPEIIDDYSEVLRASLAPDKEDFVLEEYLKPSRIIEGDYYLNGDQLVMQCAITDEVMNQTLISFDPVYCDSSSPMECIEALNQRILGYMITAENEVNSLEERPPKFKAYQLFLKALNLRGKDGYLDYLERAIAEDSSFFEPRVYRFMYYYNRGDLRRADSLLKRLELRTGMHPRQQNLLNLYDALIRGDHRNTYRYQRNEYNITPFHWETNSNMMIFSLQLVNKPEGVDSIYRQIAMENADLQKCNSCIERYKIQAMSLIELGKFQEAIDLLSGPARQDVEQIWVLRQILIRAYIRAGRIEEARQTLDSFLAPATNDWLKTDMRIFVAKELLRQEEDAQADQLLEEAIAELLDPEKFTDNEAYRNYYLGEAHFYQKDYEAALPGLREGYGINALNFDYAALLAISLEKSGRPEQAQALISEMRNNKGDYQLGELYYALATYYAAISNDEACLENLLRAISEGHWYETISFQNDPLLRDYYEHPEFKRVMTYWQ